ncbi:MAG: hypothetical protein Q7R96_01870 [Nanoarchaeota archaeon]|nr:hypothetical protein [Nanoarchaeota archaeon]
MGRIVIIPQAIEDKLVRLTTLVEEVNGVLLYRPREQFCPCEASFITGVGHEGHVQADPQRTKVVNTFFERNPEYCFVKFHTHTQETIRRFGDVYATNFSSLDIAGYDEQIRNDQRFIGMVVTPRTKLVYGHDDPSVYTMESFPEYRLRGAIIDEALLRVARSLDIDLGHKYGRQKKSP